METPTSLALGKKVIVNAADNVDRISNLSNDILVKILSELSTEETIKTSILSKRWMSVWKNIPHLFFDMRKIITINGVVLPYLLDRGAKFISKVINNHIGYLELCIIFHYSHQCEDGMLNSWILKLTDVKHTKHLVLVNFLGRLEPTLEANVLNLSAKAFSHPDLTTLTLSQYILKDANAFNDCRNITRLELIDIFAAEVDVFNNVMSSCPSLEVLYLSIFFYNPNGNLTINHKKLKMLLMSCNEIDGIEIFATLLDILSVSYALCESDKVVLKVPRLRFKRNYWVGGSLFPHTSYNISYLPKEKERNVSDLMVGLTRNHVRQYASLSISVDLKNPREVEILREVLGAWGVKMIELEISFKNNNHLVEDGEPTIGEAQNNLWETKEPFPNADFRVDTVWMYNFSGADKEQFALTSRFVMQNTVMKKIKILTSSFSKKKKLEIEVAVAKLKELPQGNKELTIECF